MVKANASRLDNAAKSSSLVDVIYPVFESCAVIVSDQREQDDWIVAISFEEKFVCFSHHVLYDTLNDLNGFERKEASQSFLSHWRGGS